MTNTKLIEYLRSHAACQEALQWLGDRDLSTCWQECTRGDWIMWLLARAGYDDAAIRRIACALIRRTPLADGRTVWDLLTDPRSREAVEVAERYADGMATDGELSAARIASWDAHGAATRIAARDAAWAAHVAATWDAAWDAARTAAWGAAWAAARDAEWYAARDAAYAAQADIIREYVPMIEIGGVA